MILPDNSYSNPKEGVNLSQAGSIAAVSVVTADQSSVTHHLPQHQAVATGMNVNAPACLYVPKMVVDNFRRCREGSGRGGHGYSAAVSQKSKSGGNWFV